MAFLVLKTSYELEKKKRTIAFIVLFLFLGIAGSTTEIQNPPFPNWLNGKWQGTAYQNEQNETLHWKIDLKVNSKKKNI